MDALALNDTELEIKRRILDAARDEFFLHGFSRVTVDEIAGKLGMSKKTLYRFFPSKEDLVNEVARVQLEEMDRSCRSYVSDENMDFVERLKGMMTYVAMQYARVGKIVLEDLQKHAPHIWKQVSAHRSEMIQERFGKLLAEGMEKGIFRKDIDKELILLIYTNAMQNVISPEILSHIPYTAAQVFEAIIKVIFEGILTDEAKAKYCSQDLASNQR